MTQDFGTIWTSPVEESPSTHRMLRMGYYCFARASGHPGVGPAAELGLVYEEASQACDRA